MRFFSNNPPQAHPRYGEMAAMARELGLDVNDCDFELIDDGLLEMVIRQPAEF